MYDTEDLIWIKNVKRSQGVSWAYDDVDCGNTFWLHWPTKKGGSANTPGVGDIIALFQKPNIINGKRNYDVHLTHLVSPITEVIHVDEDNPKHKYCREVILIAKASPIDSIPNPGYFNFFKPNRGLTNPIVNLTNNIGLTEVETQENVWRLFEGHFCPNLADELYTPEEPLGVYGEIEGDTVIKDHIRQELPRRNSRIVQIAKKTALKAGNGRLECECCDFDFVKEFGELGEKFIECHHKIHLSKGERITRIEDLALICSNCHRMLHRKRADGEYHSVESLAKLIEKQRDGR